MTARDGETRYFGVVVQRPAVDGPVLRCACGASFRYGEPGRAALWRYVGHAMTHIGGTR